MLEYHSWVSPTGGDVESVSARAVIICVGLKSVGQRGNNELRNYKQQQSDQTQEYTYLSDLDYSSTC